MLVREILVTNVLYLLDLHFGGGLSLREAVRTNDDFALVIEKADPGLDTVLGAAFELEEIIVTLKFPALTRVMSPRTTLRCSFNLSPDLPLHALVQCSDEIENRALSTLCLIGKNGPCPLSDLS